MNLNLAGAYLINPAVDSTALSFNGDTFGGLVLHVSKQTTFEKTERLVSSAINNIDENIRQKIFEFIDFLNIKSNDTEFWNQHPDVLYQGSGFWALSVWKEMGLETNKDEFRKLQDLILNVVILNYVMVVLKSPQSKSFVKKSIGKGFFSSLFT